MVGDPLGDARPNRTEDLDALTDSMLRYGYPGFEHNYGLWYDRRRDAHDAEVRTDANAFCDVSNPVRRDLHRRYIRQCLDVLGGSERVVFQISEEYTGPLSFMQFWLDTIAEWEKEHGRKVHIGLGATHDVQEAILADAAASQLGE